MAKKDGEKIENGMVSNEEEGDITGGIIGREERSRHMGNNDFSNWDYAPRRVFRRPLYLSATAAKDDENTKEVFECYYTVFYTNT